MSRRDVEGPSAPRPRVLIVEDNPANAELLMILLDHLGAATELATDGERGLARASAEPFDIIFMDLHMPVLDGFAAARAIRAQPPPRGRVPIVAVTADASPGVRDAVAAAGMDFYILKPFEAADIADALETFVA